MLAAQACRNSQWRAVASVLATDPSSSPPEKSIPRHRASLHAAILFVPFFQPQSCRSRSPPCSQSDCCCCCCCCSWWCCWCWCCCYWCLCCWWWWWWCWCWSRRGAGGGRRGVIAVPVAVAVLVVVLRLFPPSVLPVSFLCFFPPLPFLLLLLPLVGFYWVEVVLLHLVLFAALLPGQHRLWFLDWLPTMPLPWVIVWTQDGRGKPVTIDCYSC